MEQKKKIFTAKEARALAENVDSTLTRIYKIIKDCAKENSVRLDYYLYNVERNTVEKIKNCLIENGYDVKVETNEERSNEILLIIQW